MVCGVGFLRLTQHRDMNAMNVENKETAGSIHDDVTSLSIWGMGKQLSINEILKLLDNSQRNISIICIFSFI